MKLVKMFWLAALILCSASLALADGADPRVSPGQGAYPDPTPCIITTSSASCTVTSNVLEVEFSTANNVTCGISNAFLDDPSNTTGGAPSAAIYSPITSGGIANIQNYEFAPSGGECIYLAYTGTTPPDALSPAQPCIGDFSELCTPAANGCTLTNLTAGLAGAPFPADLGYANDPQDCTGIGAAQGDVISFSLLGAPDGFSLAPEIITVNGPEPGSLALLMVGLSALFVYRRRRTA